VIWNDGADYLLEWAIGECSRLDFRNRRIAFRRQACEPSLSSGEAFFALAALAGTPILPEAIPVGALAAQLSLFKSPAAIRK
jgi:hypothetical protein